MMATAITSNLNQLGNKDLKSRIRSTEASVLVFCKRYMKLSKQTSKTLDAG